MDNLGIITNEELKRVARARRLGGAAQGSLVLGSRVEPTRQHPSAPDWQIYPVRICRGGYQERQSAGK